jgi:hypothetical protein
MAGVYKKIKADIPNRDNVCMELPGGRKKSKQPDSYLLIHEESAVILTCWT